MTPAQLSYGDIKEVGQFLSEAPDVSHADLQAALINAIAHIVRLEQELARISSRISTGPAK